MGADAGLFQVNSMKIKFLSFAAALLFLAACSREDPNKTPNAPDGHEPTLLKPLQAINLLPAIPEPSGLAFNRTTGGLMVVSDALPNVFEIGLDGALRRTIPVAGSDLEGVAVSATADSLYVIEERLQQVVRCSTAGERLETFPVRVATLENSALEGLAMDAGGHLWVANEKDPRLLLEFAGSKEVSRREITWVDDLSGLCCDQDGQSLWIISDESRKLIRISRAGALLGEWSLPFNKGEGIAFAGGKLYIVNDQDSKLYVFNRPL